LESYGHGVREYLEEVMTKDLRPFESKLLSSIAGALPPDVLKVNLVIAPTSSMWAAVSTGKSRVLVMATGRAEKPTSRPPPTIAIIFMFGKAPGYRQI
jgi:hypothetical protein